MTFIKKMIYVFFFILLIIFVIVETSINVKKTEGRIRHELKEQYEKEQLSVLSFKEFYSGFNLNTFPFKQHFLSS